MIQFYLLKKKVQMTLWVRTQKYKDINKLILPNKYTLK